MRRLLFPMSLLFSLALLALAGCGSQPQRAIITTGVIENAMNEVAHNVKVVHYPRGTFAEFSSILPSTTAEIGIRPTRLVSEEAEIFWSVNGIQYQGLNHIICKYLILMISQILNLIKEVLQPIYSKYQD